MPLDFLFLPSFERSLKPLDSGQKETVRILLRALMVYYASGCDISEACKMAPRFFYKQLRKPFYEAGVEGKLRIMIRREHGTCFAVMAGNHDQIKKFLSHN